MCCLDQGFLNHLLFLFFHPIAHSDEVTFDPLLSASLYITSHSKERTASSLFHLPLFLSLNHPLSLSLTPSFHSFSLPPSFPFFLSITFSLSLPLPLSLNSLFLYLSIFQSPSLFSYSNSLFSYLSPSLPLFLYHCLSLSFSLSLYLTLSLKHTHTHK